MYSDEIIGRFTNPKYVGEIENADGIGEEGNPRCGDVMRIFIKVKNNKISDIKFLTYGCVAAIASSDMICELVKGKTVEEAKKVTSKDVVKALGEMPEIKYHCSILGMDALKAAIKDYQTKQKKQKKK